MHGDDPDECDFGEWAAVGKIGTGGFAGFAAVDPFLVMVRNFGKAARLF